MLSNKRADLAKSTFVVAKNWLMSLWIVAIIEIYNFELSCLEYIYTAGQITLYTISAGQVNRLLHDYW
jgi:hypothetical protein